MEPIGPGSTVRLSPYWLSTVNSVNQSPKLGMLATVTEPGDSHEIARRMAHKEPRLAHLQASIADERSWRVHLQDGTYGYAMESQLQPLEGWPCLKHR